MKHIEILMYLAIDIDIAIEIPIVLRLVFLYYCIVLVSHSLQKTFHALKMFLLFLYIVHIVFLFVIKQVFGAQVKVVLGSNDYCVCH